MAFDKSFAEAENSHFRDSKSRPYEDSAAALPTWASDINSATNHTSTTTFARCLLIALFLTLHSVAHCPACVHSTNQESTPLFPRSTIVFNVLWKLSTSDMQTIDVSFSALPMVAERCASTQVRGIRWVPCGAIDHSQYHVTARLKLLTSFMQSLIVFLHPA